MFLRRKFSQEFVKRLLRNPDAPCMEYLYTYISYRFKPNVSKNIPYMEPVGKKDVLITSYEDLNLFMGRVALNHAPLNAYENSKKGDTGRWGKNMFFAC